MSSSAADLSPLRQRFSSSTSVASGLGIPRLSVPGALACVQLMAAGCIGRVDFPCERAEQCNLGMEGACVDGYCAAADDACPSGLRFSEHTPFGRVCTDPTAADGSGTDGPTTGGEPVGGCVEELSVHGRHACARATNGSVTCWGEVAPGVAQTQAPAAIEGVVAASLRVANHACITQGDTPAVLCWGDNAADQIPGSGAALVFPPVEIVHSNLSTTRNDIATGLGTTCIAEADEVFCAGVIANNDVVDFPLPPGVAAVEVAAGREHICIRDAQGAVWCGGSNESLQLGQAGAGPDFVRVDLPPATTIDAARDSTCALTSEGLFCWGGNTNGNIVPGSSQPSLPVRAPEDFVIRRCGAHDLCPAS